MKKWIFAILCLGIDQLAKFIAIRSDKYVLNTSSSLGVLRLNNNWLIAISIVTVGVFVYTYWRINTRFKMVVPLLVIMSGSNILDRLFRGGVVDIFRVCKLPVFNIADFIISIIFVFLVVTYVNNQFKSR